MITTYYIVNKTNKLKNFCESKAFFYWSLVLIFGFHVLISSYSDIGPDTAIYIDIGRKIANGGKFYTEIFESNLPFNFYLYALQYKIHQWTGFNRILMSTFFIWLLFFGVLYYALKIFKNTKLSDNKIAGNMFFIAFFIGFLLRTPSIHFFEIGTKSSFLMLSLFLYLILSLEMKHELPKSTLIVRGLLMAIMPFFKVFYVLFPIAIEMFRLWNSRSWRFFIRTDIVSGLIFGLLALNFLIYWEPNYFIHMVPLWSNIYPPYQSLQLFLYGFSAVATIFIIPILAFFTIYLSRINKVDHDFIIFASVLLSGMVVLILEGLMSYDQLSVAIYCSCFFIFYVIINKNYWYLLNLKANIFPKLVLIIIFLLERHFTFNLYYHINFFFQSIWFISPLLFLGIFRISKKYGKMILRFGLINLFILALIILYAKHYLKSDLILNLIYLFNISYWIAVLYYYEKKINSNIAPVFSVMSFIIALSAPLIFLAIFLEFNLVPFSKEYEVKTPNQNYDMVYKIVSKYAPNNDDHLILFSQNAEKYPMYNYLNKDSLIKPAGHYLFFSSKNPVTIKKINYNHILLNDYLIDDLFANIEDPRYKIILINNENIVRRNFYSLHSCPVDRIENLFRSKELRDLINQNFEFIGIIHFKGKYVSKKSTSFLHKNKKITFKNDFYIFSQSHIFVRKK